MSKRSGASGKQDAQNKRAKKYATAQERYAGGANVFGLEPGMRGFSISCTRGRERQSAKEAIALLTPYITEAYPELGAAVTEEEGEGEKEEEAKEVSMEDEIAAEVESLKRQSKSAARALAQIPTVTDCLVFLRALPAIDPGLILSHVLPKIAEERRSGTKYTLRVTPITETCYANLTDIKTLVHKLVDPIINPPEGTEKPATFAVVPSIRNNNKIDRDELIQTVASVADGPCKVNLSQPDMVIIVEVLKSICLVGVVHDYYKYRKYNIRALVEEGLIDPSKIGAKKAETKTDAKAEETKAEEAKAEGAKVE